MMFSRRSLLALLGLAPLAAALTKRAPATVYFDSGITSGELAPVTTVDFLVPEAEIQEYMAYVRGMTAYLVRNGDTRIESAQPVRWNGARVYGGVTGDYYIYGGEPVAAFAAAYDTKGRGVVVLPAPKLPPTN